MVIHHIKIYRIKGNMKIIVAIEKWKLNKYIFKIIKKINI